MVRRCIFGQGVFVQPLALMEFRMVVLDFISEVREGLFFLMLDGSFKSDACRMEGV